MSKVFTGISLEPEDVEILELYKQDICRRQMIDENLSHAVRYIIRNPKDFTDWLARYESTNKKQEARSAKSDA